VDAKLRPLLRRIVDGDLKLAGIEQSKSPGSSVTNRKTNLELIATGATFEQFCSAVLCKPLIPGFALQKG